MNNDELNKKNNETINAVKKKRGRKRKNEIKIEENVNMLDKNMNNLNKNIQNDNNNGINIIDEKDDDNEVIEIID